jgi:hypothetical protein
MAQQYPLLLLLFPLGEDGFHCNIALAEQTLRDASKLYQQFLVDAFVNVEEDRLDYVRANQNDLITGTYQGIYESVLEGDAEGSSTGKIRYMFNNYHDAMAICRHYGNPNLFITFTCNVKWHEIRRELKEHRYYKTEDKLYIVT